MNQIKVTPKDFFLHLLSIVALYVGAISFLVIIFQYVNLAFPDLLEQGYYFNSDGAYRAIRWAIASLIVIFPVYVFTTRFLNGEYAKEPEKRELRVRKWLLYFTLFVAALTIIGDLVRLIFNFLEGEITVRFLLKVLAVLFVAGSVFYYYLQDLRKNTSKTKPFVCVVIGVVAAAVIAGFFVVGSPQKERLLRFDNRRVSDLQYLQSEILYFWQSKTRLPETLAELEDDIRGVRAPSDPETGAPYTYEVRGTETFALCAVFAKENKASGLSSALKPVPYERAVSENWEHGAGSFCFERTIDPELYPPIENRPLKWQL